jgi:hypothetical protein
MVYSRWIALILGQFVDFGRLPFVGDPLAFHWHSDI